MRFPSWFKVAAVVLLLAAAIVRFGLPIWRGPIGATTEYGGTLEPRQLPEFPSTDRARWVNGLPSPLASHRGEVVFIEAWGPA
jgi:hypothetical protein